MNLEHITAQVTALTGEVAAFIRVEGSKFDRARVERKCAHKELVSYVDKTAEQMLVDRLRTLVPEAGFIAEEGTETRQGERFNWVIDPLDGTTNFVHGLPPFAVSIALIDNGFPIVGVVHEVVLNECFSAWKGGGAWLNGNKISVTSVPTLDESLVAIGFPYRDDGQVNTFVEMVYTLQRSSHGVRRLGSAATDLIYVACGRLECFLELGLSPWDVAGGALIVQEAGGKVTDFKGGTDYIFGKAIVASNSYMHADVMEVVERYF